MLAASEGNIMRADLRQPSVRQEFSDLSHEYFVWMNEKIAVLCGFSIPDIVNMPLAEYVELTVGIGCKLTLEEGGVYFIRNVDGHAVAMGGIRRLPDGTAEIVRIYTRPSSRGLGFGSAMISGLINEAGRLGYRELRLDTGVFMREAQSLYKAAGFTPCEQYAGAEPPDELKPYWLYMSRSLV